MGPKKKGGGSTEAKKPGKTSKLAKMNEQERVKYLERRMAEEEESKRRKEEMINVFLKMKLNREERSTHLNSCKLLDRWRHILRESKTTHLKKDVAVLKETFESALAKKNRHIEILLTDLNQAEEQYNMAFRSQIQMSNDLLSIHESRLAKVVQKHDSERRTLLARSHKEQDVMSKSQGVSEGYLDDVLIALEQKHGNIDQALQHDYQLLRDDVRNRNMEEKQALQIQMEEGIEHLWYRLHDQVKEFQNNTDEKRRAYNELLGKDMKDVQEVSENNKRIQKLTVSSHHHSSTSVIIIRILLPLLPVLRI